MGSGSCPGPSWLAFFLPVGQVSRRGSLCWLEPACGQPAREGMGERCSVLSDSFRRGPGLVPLSGARRSPPPVRGPCRGAGCGGVRRGSPYGTGSRRHLGGEAGGVGRPSLRGAGGSVLRVRQDGVIGLYRTSRVLSRRTTKRAGTMPSEAMAAAAKKASLYPATTAWASGGPPPDEAPA